MPDDRFDQTSPGLSSPALHAFDITPADLTDLPEITRGLYVGFGGTVTVTFPSMATVTLENVPSGTVLPLRLQQVQASTTTASGLIGLV